MFFKRRNEKQKTTLGFDIRGNEIRSAFDMTADLDRAFGQLARKPSLGVYVKWCKANDRQVDIESWARMFAEQPDGPDAA